MTLPRFILRYLQRFVSGVMLDRPPDFVIGSAERPYLMRWFVIPRNPVFNIYAHMILRDDDDRALHDHPWLNCSILLDGAYREVLFRDRDPRVTFATYAVRRNAGDVVFRLPRTAHRLEVGNGDAITLFITGPKLRSWGFWCPHGWRHWREFTNPADNGATVGKGCA